MITIYVEDSATADIDAELSGLLNFRADFTPIRDAIVSTIQDVNRADRLRGVDRDGNTLFSLAASTLKRRKGDPTPFVEHGAASRAINNLIVDVDFGPRSLGIKMQWVGCGWLRYHAEGAGRLPVRDILGLRAETIGLLDAMVVTECDRKLFRRGMGRVSAFFGR